MNTPWCSLSVLFERMVSWIIKCFEGRYFVSARIYVPEAISIKVLWCVVEVWREKIRWEVFSCAQREKRVKKREEKRREKTSLTKKIPFLLLLLSLLFFWKDQNERPPLFFCKKKKEKKSHSPKKEERKEKPNKIYSSRASRNVKAASSAEKKTPTRRINKARSSSVLMIGFYIARLRDFYCADRTRIFSFCCVRRKRRKFVLSRSLSFSCWKPPSKNERKEKKWKWEKTHQKKYFIKNVAARALRKTSVLSFRARHGRDIFVMNRWRSSVFFIWTRMYLYITVYPPLLFCVFFLLLLLLVFLGLLQEEVFAFSIKKREREKSFFCVSRPLFSRPFQRLWKRQKKESSFFSSTIWREQTNERECVAEIEKYDRRKSPKRRRSIEEGTFPFLLCRFVFVFDQDVVSFREEREKREPPKKPQKRKKSFGPKKSVSSSKKKTLLLSVPKRAAKERRGLQNKFWIVSKTFITQL